MTGLSGGETIWTNLYTF